MEDKSQVVIRLLEAAKSGIPCPPIRHVIGEKDIEAAYDIQLQILQSKLEAGAKMVGKKVGLTSEAVQKQLGVSEPDFGVLLDTMEVRNGWNLDFNDLMQPKIEAEIAFILGKDLDSAELSLDEVKDACSHAVCALEIVGSRIAKWNIRITDTIADNASASHFVLGSKPVPIGQIDLLNCHMEMHRNEQLVSSGLGHACLGSPLNAVLWLARKLHSMGSPLRKGEIVLSGALGPMSAVEKGDTFQASIEGLGSVSVHIS